jgi:hypothetical protein
MAHSSVTKRVWFHSGKDKTALDIPPVTCVLLQNVFIACITSFICMKSDYPSTMIFTEYINGIRCPETSEIFLFAVLLRSAVQRILKPFFIWWVKRAEREADQLLVVRRLHYAKIWRDAPIHVHLRVLWRRNNYCYAAALYLSGPFEYIPETYQYVCSAVWPYETVWKSRDWFLSKSNKVEQWYVRHNRFYCCFISGYMFRPT